MLRALLAQVNHCHQALRLLIVRGPTFLRQGLYRWVEAAFRLVRLKVLARKLLARTEMQDARLQDRRRQQSTVLLADSPREGSPLHQPKNITAFHSLQALKTCKLCCAALSQLNSTTLVHKLSAVVHPTNSPPRHRMATSLPAVTRA